MWITSALRMCAGSSCSRATSWASPIHVTSTHCTELKTLLDYCHGLYVLANSCRQPTTQVARELNNEALLTEGRLGVRNILRDEMAVNLHVVSEHVETHGARGRGQSPPRRELMALITGLFSDHLFVWNHYASKCTNRLTTTETTAGMSANQCKPRTGRQGAAIRYMIVAAYRSVLPLEKLHCATQPMHSLISSKPFRVGGVSLLEQFHTPYPRVAEPRCRGASSLGRHERRGPRPVRYCAARWRLASAVNTFGWKLQVGSQTSCSYKECARAVVRQQRGAAPPPAHANYEEEGRRTDSGEKIIQDVLEENEQTLIEDRPKYVCIRKSWD
ncbi:jg24665 [Pararge aegeria aegeria]|uniref:Jg24665 protein n=1 Tax=Pararge aegeria aegeria TaxID=348720 RepID=A0A8S4QLM8_9NEOP|nr:jg24665 [Pararge aegeria aegeria]